jgi:hypothetical protein
MSSDAHFLFGTSPIMQTELFATILAKKIVDLFVFFYIFEATIGENFNLLIDLLLF